MDFQDTSFDIDLSTLHITIDDDKNINSEDLLGAINLFGVEAVCNKIIDRGPRFNHASEEESWGDFLFRLCRDRERGKMLLRHFRYKLSPVANRVLCEGLTPLQYALRCNNVSAAEELLECDPALLDARWHGFNLLHYCVLINSLDGAKLIHRWDDEYISDLAEVGSTSLLLAAEHADVDMFKWLLQNGQNIHSRNKNTRATIFHYAARNKHFGAEIIKYVLKIFGFFPFKDTNGETALHYALRRENFDVVHVLMEEWPTNADDSALINLLHFCVKNNFLEGAMIVHKRYPDELIDLMGLGMTPSQLTTDVEMQQWLSQNFNAF